MTLVQRRHSLVRSVDFSCGLILHIDAWSVSDLSPSDETRVDTKRQGPTLSSENPEFASLDNGKVWSGKDTHVCVNWSPFPSENEYDALPSFARQATLDPAILTLPFTALRALRHWRESPSWSRGTSPLRSSKVRPSQEFQKESGNGEEDSKRFRSSSGLSLDP